ncbi:Gfo/Idh/MocA family oxidoreductase [Candidatus Harpocratesius sp.]
MNYPKKTIEILNLKGPLKLTLHLQIAVEIIPKILQFDSAAIPLGVPGNPILGIFDPKFWKKNTREWRIKLLILKRKKLFSPHFTFVLWPNIILPVFYLESNHLKIMNDFMKTANFLITIGMNPIIITKSELIKENFTDFTKKNKNFPILTASEFIILMQCLIHENAITFFTKGKYVSFVKVITNLHKIYKKYPIQANEEQILSIMKAMGIKIQPKQQINLENSVFGKGGSWEKVGNKKPTEVKMGIVGMGERGIQMFEQAIKFGMFSKPKSERVDEIVAICDVNPDALENAVTRLKINEIPPEDRPRMYTSLEEFLADPEIDIVQITVPATIDQEIGKMVIKAGKAPMLIAKDEDARLGKGPLPL